MTQQSFVFYTSRLQGDPGEDRWAYTGIPDIFYHTYVERTLMSWLCSRTSRPNPMKRQASI